MKQDTGTRFRSLLFTSLGHFINDGEGFLIPLIAAALATLRGMSPLEVTVMYLAFYSSSAILSVYIGNLADKIGKPGTLIAVGLSFVSFGFIGIYFSATYLSGVIFFPFIVFSAFLAGLGGAFYHPLSASILQSTFKDKSRGKALGINGALGSVGRALYPSLLFLIAIVVTTFDAIAILALVGFMAALIIWAGLKGPKTKTQNEQSFQRKTKFTSAFTKGIIILTVVSFIRSFALLGVNSWIPTFISIQKGVGITNLLGATLTIMYASAIIGQPIFGALVDKFDKRLILGLSSVGSGLSIIGYLFTTGISEIAFLSLFGLFAFSAFPLVLSLSADYAPEGGFSLANSLVWGLGVSGGGVVGPVIAGLIISNNYSNLGLTFEIMTIIVLISAALTALIPKAQKSTKVPIFH